MFSNKVLLITGGTGSFGKAVLERFLKTDIKEIRIFSRDEKKQDDLRKKYGNDKLKFYLGDVRDKESIFSATKDCDFIFHAAALKQVPSCEFYPLEAVKTNVIGTDNVITIGCKNNVKKIICLSTDKAVYPINSMGMSKAMMEKIAIAKSRIFTDTIISVTRYGNVMASRGSVIPLFLDQIKKGDPITITDPNMTRFMLTLNDAVDLVLKAFVEAKSGDIYVKKAPACTIKTLAKALLDLIEKKDYPIKNIGTRHGEKLYEVLVSKEEMMLTTDLGDYFKISPDLRDLNYGKFIDTGETISNDIQEYNSHNVKILEMEGMKKLLLKIDPIKYTFRKEF